MKSKQNKSELTGLIHKTKIKFNISIKLKNNFHLKKQKKNTYFVTTNTVKLRFKLLPLQQLVNPIN
jgi:hypothetical protein